MRVFLFDIDGTLVSSGGAGKAAMEAALVACFQVSERDHKVPFAGRTDRAIARDLLQHYGIEDTAVHWKLFMAEYLRLLPIYLHSHKGQVLPGIRSILEHLSAQPDVAVGLLTGNIRDGARLKLGHFGLYQHFPFGGFGDHHLDRSDVAREALAAIHQHVAEPVDLSNIWVVGDTPLDVSCARTIGVRVAAVATGFHSLAELKAAQPDLLFADLSDPGPLLAL